MTAKERNLIKGAIRRVFSRSDIRESIIAPTRVEHFDPNRKRVKKWCKCPLCKEFCPEYLMAVDHINPVIPVDSALENMTWDELVDNLWCEYSNLQSICESCHTRKSKSEQKERKENRKKRKNK